MLSTLIALALAIPPADTHLVDVTHIALPLATVGGRSMDAEFGDLDGDGNPDLVVANEFGQNFVLFNDGIGGFDHDRHALPQGHTHDSEDIAIIDVDGDGDLDLVFVAEDDMTNELYINDGEGRFHDASDRLPSAAGTTNAVLALDVDGDGDADLLLGNAGPNALWLNDGSGHFEDASAAWLPGDPATTQDIEAGDVDGDGVIDLVVANESDNVLLVGRRGGPFTAAAAGRFPCNGQLEESREIDLGDIDGDGDLDAFVANVAWRQGFDGRNRLLLNDGRGTFTEAPPAMLPNAAHSTVDADLVDLDGDGQLEIVLAQVSGPGCQVLRHDGERFVDVTAAWFDAVPSALKGIDVEVLDVNADGVLDVFICNHAGADRLWHGAPR